MGELIGRLWNARYKTHAGVVVESLIEAGSQEKAEAVGKAFAERTSGNLISVRQAIVADESILEPQGEPLTAESAEKLRREAKAPVAPEESEKDRKAREFKERMAAREKKAAEKAGDGTAPVTGEGGEEKKGDAA